MKRLLIALASTTVLSTSATAQEPVYLETITRIKQEGLTLEMTEPRYFPLIGYPEAWTPSTAGEIVATPIYVGDKTAPELEGLRTELHGAIVLLTAPQVDFIDEDRLQPAATTESVPLGAPRTVRAEGPVPTFWHQSITACSCACSCQA